MTSFLRSSAILAAAAVLAGCGSNSSLPLATVTGTVSCHGKPLQHGKVVFVPERGTPGPQAIGAIESDGTFRMRTLDQDGAAIGRHRVMVHCRRPLRPEERKMMIVPESLIPEKYSREAESPLRFEVKEGGNEYPIDLE